MTHDENPLDRISSGPAPQGPSPWRSNRLPTGSPYANGLYGTGNRKSPRRLGRSGWICLIAAVVLLAGAVGWAAVSKPDTGTVGLPLPTGAATAPAPPSVDQITGSGLFTTALATPATCALPALSTDREAVQRFAAAATGCLEGVWGLRAYRVELFSSPDDLPPGDLCSPRGPISSFGSCGETTFVNYDGVVESTGNQAGGLLQWLALAVADRADSRSGVNADVQALVRATGGGSSPQGTEYLKRSHVQGLCLAGATLQRLVGHGISPADLAQASNQARTWILLGAQSAGTKLSRETTQSWFDRGSLAPTQEVCRTAWTVPVDQVS